MAFRPAGLKTVAAAIAGLLLLGSAPSAVAQAGPQIPPPAAYDIVDARGVNLFTGQMTVSTTPITVGDPDDGGLSYSATWDTAVNKWRNSVAGMVARTPFIPPNNDHPWYTVTVMGQTAVFRPEPDDTYVPVDGVGTLVETADVFTYTALDGTVAVFAGGKTYTPFLANEGLISTVTRPNGEVIGFTYTEITMTNGFPARRLQSVNNNLGYQLHFQYALDGTWGNDWYRLIKVTALNNAVDYCAPTAATCAFSRTWPSLSFSETSTQQSVTDSLNRTMRLIFPAFGRLGGIARPTTPSGQNVTIEWNGPPYKVASVSDGAGTWNYTFQTPPAVNPPPVEQTYTTTIQAPAPSGSTVVTMSDTELLADPFLQRRVQRIASVTNAVGATTTYDYDIFDTFRLYGITYPEGDQVRYGYTDRGDLTETTRIAKPGSGLASTTVVATFADCSTPTLCGRPTAITDARGATTDYIYAAHGGLLTETEPADADGVRPQTRYAWEARSAWYRQSAASTQVQAPTWVWRATQASTCSSGLAPACVGTANEVRTTTTYQAGNASTASNLLPVSVSSGSGNGTLTATTTSTYDAVGNAEIVTGPLGGSDYTRNYYDAMRQVIGVASGSPDNFGPRNFPAVRNTYNADGQPTLIERGTNLVQGGSAFSTFTPLESLAHAYDAQGRKTRDTESGGSTVYSVTQYAYDAVGNPTCTAQRMNPASWSSLPASACDLAPAGTFGPDRITFNTYDDADRLLTTQTGYGTTDLRTLLTQSYTPNGRIDWVQDAQANRSDYVYDGFDRMARISFPLPTTGSQAANPSDYEDYGYDASDNPTSKRTRSGDVFTTTFDALNRITFIDAPSGSNDVGYAYDLLDRRLSTTHPGGQSVAMTWDALGRQLTETGRLGTVSMAYDLKGRMTQQTWPGAAFSVGYTWYLDDQMASATVNGSQSVATFVYDKLGRRTLLTRGNGTTTTYGYDGASRLTSLAHDLSGTANDQIYGFAYSPAGQMVTRTTTNSAYSFAPAANDNTYVNNGLNQATTAGALALSWDARGNLTQLGTVTQTYDAANRLITNGGGTLDYDPLDRLSRLQGTQGAVYGYAGSQEIAYLANDGVTVNNRFVRGPWPDEILASWSGTSMLGPVWWIQDHQASTIAIADASGAAVGLNRYDEYGRPASGNTARFQFTGQLWMGDFGVYHYKARAYHPGLGRFMQTDPVGYEAGMNLYAYVGDDPVNLNDPTGMIGQDRFDQMQRRNDIGDQAADDYNRLVAEQAGPIIDFVADFVPVVGDIRGVADFIGDPSLLGGVAVAAGLIPGVGDGAGALIRGAERNALRREVGSYTNLHESGMEYHGKGTRDRSQASGRRIESATGDAHIATEFTPAPSDRQAFVDEDSRIQGGGGVENPRNYNQRNSPGRRY